MEAELEVNVCKSISAGKQRQSKWYCYKYVRLCVLNPDMVNVCKSIPAGKWRWNFKYVRLFVLHQDVVIICKSIPAGKWRQS